MSGTEQQQIVRWELPVQDAQLVMQILQQALAPYQRLAQVMQDMQRQAMAGQGAQNVQPPAPATDPRNIQQNLGA